jgi:quercetin dioxygenase-like cupin family protein
MVISIPPKHSFRFDSARINIYHADKNQGISKHEHEYSHATVCYAGALRVTKENVDIVITKDSQPVVLKGGEWHELEAVEDGTVFSNIFADEFMQKNNGY